MSLYSRWFGERDVETVNDYAALYNMFMYGGNGYSLGYSGIQQTM